MFMLRLIFWGALILMLLPSSQEDKQALYGTAERTAQDFASFCNRNPQVCETVGNAAGTLLQKIQVGAGMIRDAIDAWRKGEAPHQQAPAGDAKPVTDRLPQKSRDAAESVSRYTLTSDDLKPEWRGPVASR
jgi:hypothetical protein